MITTIEGFQQALRAQLNEIAPCATVALNDEGIVKQVVVGGVLSVTGLDLTGDTPMNRDIPNWCIETWDNENNRSERFTTDATQALELSVSAFRARRGL